MQDILPPLIIFESDRTKIEDYIYRRQIRLYNLRTGWEENEIQQLHKSTNQVLCLLMKDTKKNKDKGEPVSFLNYEQQFISERKSQIFEDKLFPQNKKMADM